MFCFGNLVFRISSLAFYLVIIFLFYESDFDEEWIWNLGVLVWRFKFG